MHYLQKIGPFTLTLCHLGYFSNRNITGENSYGLRGMIFQCVYLQYFRLGLFFFAGCKLLFRVILPSGAGKNIVHEKTTLRLAITLLVLKIC